MKSPNQERFEELASLIELVRSVSDKIKISDLDLISKQFSVILGSSDSINQDAARKLVHEIVDSYKHPRESAIVLPRPANDGNNDPWRAHISKKVYVLRSQANMTQAGLAEKTGIPQSHISRIESGDVSPTFKTVAKIAEALGVEHSQLDPSL